MISPSSSHRVAYSQLAWDNKDQELSWSSLRKYQIVSLWVMLRIYAKDFSVLLTTLDRFATRLGEFPSLLASAGHDLRDEAVRQAVCKGFWNTLVPTLDDVEGACKRLELNFALDKTKKIKEQFGGKPFEFSSLEAATKELRERVDYELNERMFIFIPTERARFLDEAEPPLGNAVRERFPEVAGDALSASQCLGVGLPTGAVFYLMRVTEFGIRRVTKRLRVKASKVRRKTWDGILKEINAAIAALTALSSLSARQRTVRNKCAEAAAHLNNVRIAWRNPVMHAERAYTQEEAEEIFNNVKTFMNYLATEVR